MSKWIIFAAVVTCLPTAADAQMITVEAGCGISSGTGAGVERLPDGRWVADNGKDKKTCAENQLAVASTSRTVIETLHGKTEYPDGLVACYDLSEFGGAAVFDAGTDDLLLQPAKPST